MKIYKAKFENGEVEIFASISDKEALKTSIEFVKQYGDCLSLIELIDKGEYISTRNILGEIKFGGFK
jgi:hypothetical protein